MVLDRAIDRLVAFADRTPEAGIWGGRTLKGDGTLDPSCAFGDQTLWSIFCRTTGLSLIFSGSSLFNPEYYGGWQRDSERAVGTIMGCFFLIRRAALGGARRLRPQLRDLWRGDRSLPPRPRPGARPAAADARGGDHPLRRRLGAEGLQATS